VSTVIVVIAAATLAWRHRPGAAVGDRWGEPPERLDDLDVVEEIEVDDEIVDETADEDEIVDDDGAGADRGRSGGG